jgi:hypothetical protein
MRVSPRVVAFDTETCLGRPFALGVSDEHEIVHCWATRRRQALLRLLDELWRMSMKGKHDGKGLVAAAHFLRFDLTVMVVDYLGPQWRKHFDRERFTLRLRHATIDGHVGQPAFATVRFDNHQSVTLLDTASYFVMSLNRAAQMVGVTEQKLGKPDGLGYKVIPLDVIRPYLQRDVSMCLAVAKQIVSWWSEWKIRPAVSAPHFASRVFRHAFVKRAWVDVPSSVEQKALLAYHGGKNGFYGKPGWYRKVYSYDIRSAYSWAMTQIPDMTRGEWRWSKTRRNRNFGFLTVSGETPSMQRYPVFFTHDFQPIGPSEKISNLTVTGMEYDTMLVLYPSTKLTILSAVTWHPDIREPSDLACYARAMWSRRLAARKAKHKTEEELYKLLANSLYGKFIARVEDEDGFRKGEIFYAPVAAWITGLVRSRITRLEHAADALHTSTDGFLCTKRLPKRMLGENMGAVKLVNEGPLVIVRNKCYLHFKKDGTLDHAALHGFQGRPVDLWRLIQTGRTTYVRERLSGLLESYRGAGLPFAPMTRRMRLHVPDLAALRREGGNPYGIRPRF